MYKRLSTISLILFFLLLLSFAFLYKSAWTPDTNPEVSYGLCFNSHESLPEKRTALEMPSGEPLYFSGAFSLEFEMNFVEAYKVYFGYILRIVNDKNNIDLIYDQGTALFRLIEGQKFSEISFKLDSSHLFHQWNKIAITVDPDKHVLELKVNGKLIGRSAVSFTGPRFKFLWGANDNDRFKARDLPPMNIREVRVFENNRLSYHWPLNEFSGSVSYDELHQKKAFIKNANWLKSLHQNWSLVNSFTLKGSAVAAFDTKKEQLYLAGSDSVFVYSTKQPHASWLKIPVKTVNLQIGSHAIYDTITDKLYDVLIDFNHQKEVATWSFPDKKWNRSSFDTIFTEYLHANKFISPVDTSLYLIGGYGLEKYKNIIQRYHLISKKWDTVVAHGDFLPPRYLAALGTNSRGDTAYIMGGYGSYSGDQMLNPGNFYDVFAFDIKSGTFTKIFNLDTLHQPAFVFANSLVINSKAQQYYGLMFSNDRFHSNLQLITGSLKNSTFSLLGDKLPFSFYDLQSFSDLYYAPAAGKLIAVTLFYSKPEAREKSTTIRIYSINFPPSFFPDISRPSDSRVTVSYILLILSSVFLALAIVFYFINSNKLKRALISVSNTDEAKLDKTDTLSESLSEDKSEIVLAEEENIPRSQIFLFGQFRVLDKEGIDITDLFTPLLKELFLLILIYTSRERGISSDGLNEILWREKSVKDAKNNRSVNLAKLKNILERVGDCKLIKQSGFWHFQVLGDSIYVDYEKYMSICCCNNKPEIKEGKYIKELLSIAKKGSLLFQTEYDWLDDVKSEVSNFIIDTLLMFVNSKNGRLSPEFLVEIANCIFHFDQLNENALEHKCRSLILLKKHLLANKTYAKFCKDYKNIYGEDFGRSFNDIIKNDPAATALL